MPWIYLIIAGVFEWGWPVGLKLGMAETGLRWSWIVQRQYHIQMSIFLPSFLRLLEDPWTEDVDVNKRQRTAGTDIATTATSDVSQRGLTPWIPPCDIVEKDNEWDINVELPGMTVNDVKIDFDSRNNVVCLSGERERSHREEKEREGVKYTRSERSYGSFRRSFQIPPNSDPDKISATFNNGMLNMKVPKTEQARTLTRRINIQQ
jgi:HSP20 family protein